MMEEKEKLIREGYCSECGRPLPIGIYLCRNCKGKHKTLKEE